jgi:pimeloyl-ACP methyl ester carboxylesterase
MKLTSLVLAATALVVACGTEGAPNGPVEPTPVAEGTPPPAQSVSAATETVRVQNERGTVEGTLEVPEAVAPVPLVIIVSGSGTQDRDGNTPSGSKPDIYRLLAVGLRDAGIASIRYDDPGYAKSASAFPKTNEEITYEMEVDIVGRWVDTMREDPRFSAIAIAGHSQGSLSAILAAETRDVAVVSLAGAGRPIGDVLREQLAPKLDAEQLSTLDEALAKLERGELAGPLPAPLNQILDESIQPYFISWMKYDPRAEIAKLSTPALILQGRTDVQVSERDAELLAEGKADAELRFVDDMGHMLRRATVKDATKQRARYEKPDLPLHPAVVSTIGAFVHAFAAR